MNEREIGNSLLKRLQDDIHSFPVEKQKAFWRTVAMVIRCFLEDSQGVLLLVEHEGENGETRHLTTTGINSTYEESYDLVSVSYAMFVEAEEKGAGSETLQ